MEVKEGLVAEPFAIETVKSDVSRSPLPPAALYTFSEKVMVTLLLSEESTVDEKVGAVLSMFTDELFVISDCVTCVALVAVCIEDASIANVTVPSVSALSTV